MHIVLARDSHGAPEIFRSIQGEGPCVGRVRTFIRLSGCNLHCVWCDTAYTWNWIGTLFQHQRDEPGAPHKFVREQESIRLTIEEAAAIAVAISSEGFVITGGEPLMQREPLLALIDALRASAPESRIEIETNGSIAPSAVLCDRVDLFVVSPKLAHSGNGAATALKVEALRAFATISNAVFKFVAHTTEDVTAAADLARAYDIEPTRVYIMPEGAEADALREVARAIAPTILACDFNFTPRLHIELFGAVRGA